MGDYLRLVAQLELHPHLRSKLDPADLAQQALLKALAKWPDFKGRTERELYGWVRSILLNDLADQERKLLRNDGDGHHSLEGSRASLAAELVAEQTSPSQRAIRHELWDRLAIAMAQLPEDQRRAVEMRHIEGLSVAEIATKMDRTSASVAGLLRRGLDSLRDVM
jgi:RNA polymerase sigma-70 factor (ECF subfamily)